MMSKIKPCARQGRCDLDHNNCGRGHQLHHRSLRRDYKFLGQHLLGIESGGESSHNHGHTHLFTKSLDLWAVGDLKGNRSTAVQPNLGRQSHVQERARNACNRRAGGGCSDLQHFVPDFRDTHYYSQIRWQLTV
jgi:hypothetical protein